MLVVLTALHAKKGSGTGHHFGQMAFTVIFSNNTEKNKYNVLLVDLIGVHCHSLSSSYCYNDIA